MATTDKRDTIRALLTHGELPERMGLNEHFWPHILDNAWREQGVAPGTDFDRRFDLDLKMVGGYNLPSPRPDLETVIEEADDWKVHRDGWGATFKTWKRRAGTPEHVGFALTTPKTWHREFRDAFLAHDPASGVDFAKIRRDREEAESDGFFSTYCFMFVFEQLRARIGDVAMLEALLLEKEWIHDFNRCVTDHFLAAWERILEECGEPDGIHFFEDLGYTRSPFASPACHREMVLPYHREIVGFFKDRGLPVIMHTCGDFRPHIPAIVEAGVDCIQAMEAKTGMDVVDLAGEWKDDLCFMGNLDVRAYESGDRDLLRDEILAKVEGMKRLRAPYVAMSDHSIPPSVTVTDYEWSLDLIRDHYRY